MYVVHNECIYRAMGRPPLHDFVEKEREGEAAVQDLLTNSPNYLDTSLDIMRRLGFLGGTDEKGQEQYVSDPWVEAMLLGFMWETRYVSSKVG